MKLIILTTSYNCENYIERCLLSIKSQSHKNFICYITDDLSTDTTIKKIEECICDDNRFILIKNKEKKYQGGNYDQVIRDNHDISDEDVCIEVDGDDWLPDSNVFKRIHEVFEDNNIWIANGSFKYHDGRSGFAKAYTSFDNIRNETFTLTHIRTWRAFLWRKIKEEDLKDKNGNFWKVAGDLSFMYPMVEMSGIEHYKFMPQINYIYNEENPINDHKVNMNFVIDAVNKIKKKNIYQKIIKI